MIIHDVYSSKKGHNLYKCLLLTDIENNVY